MPDAVTFALAGVSALTAIVGAVVAVIHAGKAIAASARANEIQEAMLALHKSAAADRVADRRTTEWHCELMSDHRHLVIENRGPAPAQNVTVMLGDAAVEEALMYRGRSGDPREVSPGARLTFTFFQADGVPASRDVMVHWDDPDGKQKVFRTVV